MTLFLFLVKDDVEKESGTISPYSARHPWGRQGDMRIAVPATPPHPKPSMTLLHGWASLVQNCCEFQLHQEKGGGTPSKKCCWHFYFFLRPLITPLGYCMCLWTCDRTTYSDPMHHAICIPFFVFPEEVGILLKTQQHPLLFRINPVLSP